MPRKTLLLIADAFYPAELPPESQTNSFLAIELGRRGWTVQVWSGEGAQVPPSSINVVIQRVAKKWNLFEVARIAWWLAKQRPQKVVLMYFTSSYSQSAAITLVPALAKLAGVPSITYFTNANPPPPGTKLHKLLLWLTGRSKVGSFPVGALGTSDRLIFLSEANRNKLLLNAHERFGLRCDIVSPPFVFPSSIPVDRSKIRKSLGLGDADFVVAHFGVIYRQKGIEWLLDAMELLKRKADNGRLILIGPKGSGTGNTKWTRKTDKYDELLKKRSDGLGVSPSVQWLGQLDRVKVVETLLSCDVACLPFKQGVTNQRSSFITCAKLGMPIITTLTSETDRFLKDQQSGIIYVDPGNAAQIAEKLFWLLQNPESRRRHGRLIKTFADSKFDNQRFVDCFDF